MLVLLREQVFMTMMHSGVELTITTFGTLLIAAAETHDYALVQEASPACLAPCTNEKPLMAFRQT